MTRLSIQRTIPRHKEQQKVIQEPLKRKNSIHRTGISKPEFPQRKDPQVSNMGTNLNLYPVTVNSETQVTWHTLCSQHRELGIFYNLYLISQLNVNMGSNPATLLFSFFLLRFSPSLLLRHHWVGRIWLPSKLHRTSGTIFYCSWSEFEKPQITLLSIISPSFLNLPRFQMYLFHELLIHVYLTHQSTLFSPSFLWAICYPRCLGSLCSLCQHLSTPFFFLLGRQIIDRIKK